VHELEPKLIITVMHGQQHIKIEKGSTERFNNSEFLSNSRTKLSTTPIQFLFQFSFKW